MVHGCRRISQLPSDAPTTLYYGDIPECLRSAVVAGLVRQVLGISCVTLRIPKDRAFMVLQQQAAANHYAEEVYTLCSSRQEIIERCGGPRQTGNGFS